MSRRERLWLIVLVLLLLTVLAAVFYIGLIVPTQSQELSAILTRQAITR
jgi:hypothetical protein